MDFEQHVLIHPAIALFDPEDMRYADPAKSFWMSESGREDGLPLTLLAKVLRVDEEAGTMEVIGIDHDIRIDVPIMQAIAAGDEFWGDFSLPARGWHVFLMRSSSGDYYPMNYMRPFQMGSAWKHEGHAGAQPGDFLVQMSPTGGKLHLSASGDIELAAGPSSYFQLFSAEDGEGAQLISRELFVKTPHGSLSMAPEGEGSLLTLTGFYEETSEKSYAKLSMGSLGDEQGAGLLVYESEMPVSGLMFYSDQAGLQANKLFLAGDTPFENKEPVPRGNVLQRRLENIEQKLGEVIAALNTHGHKVAVNPITGLPEAIFTELQTSLYAEAGEQLLSEKVYIP